jgi:hypothetical protein
MRYNMTEQLTFFLLGFGMGFLVFIVLPVIFVGTLSMMMTRAKRKNPSKVAEIVRELAAKGRAMRRGGNEKGHTKESALAITENEVTGKKKKIYAS